MKARLWMEDDLLVLAVIGVFTILVGGLFALGGILQSEPVVIAVGLSTIVTGILFLAIDRGLSLLKEIRDALLEEKIPHDAVKKKSFYQKFLEG